MHYPNHVHASINLDPSRRSAVILYQRGTSTEQWEQELIDAEIDTLGVAAVCATLINPEHRYWFDLDEFTERLDPLRFEFAEQMFSTDMFKQSG